MFWFLTLFLVITIENKPIWSVVEEGSRLEQNVQSGAEKHVFTLYTENPKDSLRSSRFKQSESKIKDKTAAFQHTAVTSLLKTKTTHAQGVIKDLYGGDLWF